MRDTLIYPVIGNTYHNRCGSDFRCVGYDGEAPIFERISDGWTLLAHCVYQESDGNIYWGYSTNGHWKDGEQ
mgnify:CR=1 FL=1